MVTEELREIVINLAKNKVAELSQWKNIQWEGGRLYYEGNKIINEIQNFNDDVKLIYLETIFGENFVMQDNWPNSAPDITEDLKLWLKKKIIKLKISQIQTASLPSTIQLEEISLNGLEFKDSLLQIIEFRISEIRQCFSAKAFLSVIFLTGSTLEGILIGIANKYPKSFNTSISSPKSNGTAKPLNDWKLEELINVANNIGLLSEDIKAHSHSIRNFRNYIHPNEQLKTGFIPDENTAKIAWQVLKASLDQILKNLNKLQV
jgi:hypothetical protein